MRLLIGLLTLALAGPTVGVAASRFDFSAATGRSDAETLGWMEWEIGSQQSDNRSLGSVDVRISAVDGSLEGFLKKASLATGATLAADGVRCDGPIEVSITGLAAGKHTIATYHNLPDGKPTKLTVSVGDATTGVTPTSSVEDDTEMATGFVEFEAADAAVTLRIEAADGGPVVLNALELDANDPRRRARGPLPANHDWHVAGDEGRVTLRWNSVEDAEGYRVYLASGPDLESALAKLKQASDPVGTPSDSQLEVPVAASDSLRCYCWRVDTVHGDGNVVPGEPWAFRVRHLAFPGAEGYGRFARGGRGGRVMKVTNLDDSGPGSLRAAVEAEGPRTVIFDVSGRIVLEDRLVIRNGQLTIAGQSAPGIGICISNFNLGGLGADDLLIRYVRVRPGDTSGKTLDGMGLAGCDHSIVDHCSISWTQDESFSSRGAGNITLQRTLISEALNIAGHKKYEQGKSHGFAASIGGDIGSFHHNLLAHCAGRNWSLAGGVDQATRHQGVLDIRNNVVYNWDHRTTDGGARLVQFVNNYYKPGPATRVFHVLKPERKWVEAFGPQEYYASGNVMEGRYENQTNYQGIEQEGDESLANYMYDEPFFPAHVDTQSADEAYRNVLSDVGCNFPNLDDHDRRVLQETIEGTTTYTGSLSGKPGLPDSQEDVGGWDQYPEQHRAEDWDTDGDGMPNDWERQRELDPSNPADGSADADGDGFTNLEEYLNELVE